MISMQIIESRLVILALGFILTLVTGAWLSRAGKPFNQVVFTLHKLLALAFVIFAGVMIHHLQKPMGINPVIIGASVVILLLVLLVFITGVLLSSEKPANALVLTLHKLAPVLLALSISGALYLILNKS
jgi:hypothetical protein